MKKFFMWLATVVEDKAGAISSKRVGFFFTLWIINNAMKNPEATGSLIWPLIVLAAALAAVTLPEWFSNLKNK